MKTRYWIMALAAAAAVCAGLSFWLLRSGDPAGQVRVISEGQVLVTLPLHTDRDYTVRSSRGVNVITIKQGKVAVTQADCPDHHCMNRGFCNSGPSIVCLPNRLVLEFTNQAEVDGVAG